MKPATEDYNKKADLIFEYMKAHRRYCSKEELCELVHCSERIVRDLINYIRNKGYCICATSSKKGYKLMSYMKYTREDFEDVQHMLREIESRKLELESMQKCCERFFKKADEYQRSLKKEGEKKQ